MDLSQLSNCMKQAGGVEQSIPGFCLYNSFHPSSPHIPFYNSIVHRFCSILLLLCSLTPVKSRCKLSLLLSRYSPLAEQDMIRKFMSLI
jgi:hypothetical protein